MRTTVSIFVDAVENEDHRKLNVLLLSKKTVVQNLERIERYLLRLKLIHRKNHKSKFC